MLKGIQVLFCPPPTKHSHPSNSHSLHWSRSREYMMGAAAPRLRRVARGGRGGGGWNKWTAFPSISMNVPCFARRAMTHRSRWHRQSHLPRHFSHFYFSHSTFHFIRLHLSSSASAHSLVSARLPLFIKPSLVRVCTLKMFGDTLFSSRGPPAVGSAWLTWCRICRAAAGVGAGCCSWAARRVSAAGRGP